MMKTIKIFLASTEELNSYFMQYFTPYCIK